MSNFNSTLVSARLLAKLKRALVTNNIVNRNYEGELTGPEDTVKIMTPNGTTIRDYDGTPITVDTIDGSSQELAVELSKYFAFIADDTENVSAYVDAFINEDFYALLAAAEGYVLGKYSDADAANEITFDPASDELVAKIREARAALTKQNVPSAGRYIVIGPDELNLVEDFLVQRETAMGDGVVRAGFEGRLAGFNVYVSNNLKETGSSPQYRHCVYGHTSAITYADAIVQVESMRSQEYFGDMVRGLMVSGAKVIRSNALGDLRHKIA